MGLLDKLFTSRPKVVPTPVRTVADFQKHVLRSELPVIVDVWSLSCAPCRQLAPVLVRVATEHQDKVRVVEISTESEPALLARLGVRATPTVIVYDGGKEMGRVVGFKPKSWFDEMIATEFS